MRPGDEDDATEEPEQPETIASNRWLELRVSDGYGIWPKDAPLDSDPIASFDATESGFDDADREFRRRTTELRLFYQLPIGLAWIVSVSVVVWVASAVVESLFLLGILNFTRSYTPSWIQATTQLSYSVWLGALALLFTLWLVGRAQREKNRG